MPATRWMLARMSMLVSLSVVVSLSKIWKLDMKTVVDWMGGMDGVQLWLPPPIITRVCVSYLAVTLWCISYA